MAYSIKLLTAITNIHAFCVRLSARQEQKKAGLKSRNRNQPSKTDATLKEMKEVMQAKTQVRIEFNKKSEVSLANLFSMMDTNHEKMRASVNARREERKADREETMACQETMETYLECKDPTWEEI
jgi:hypothetical protein